MPVSVQNGSDLKICSTWFHFIESVAPYAVHQDLMIHLLHVVAVSNRVVFDVSAYHEVTCSLLMLH